MMLANTSVIYLDHGTLSNSLIRFPEDLSDCLTSRHRDEDVRFAVSKLASAPVIAG